jgi:nitroreductase
MLAAAEQGLASLPMEGFDESRVRAALGIPRRYAVPCVVAVGYATEGAAGAARAGRFELAEMFAADRFETPWTPTLAAE